MKKTKKDKKKKKELQFINSLYNRQVQQNINSALEGLLIGGISSILLYRIKNRFLLCGISSAITCNYVMRKDKVPFFNDYFKIWDEIKNDKISMPKFEGDFAKHGEFKFFYSRYLTYYYPELCINESWDRECWDY